MRERIWRPRAVVNPGVGRGDRKILPKASLLSPLGGEAAPQRAGFRRQIQVFAGGATGVHTSGCLERIFSLVFAAYRTGRMHEESIP
jgi:hypothetical protein